MIVEVVKRIKWSYELVKKYIEDNSKCKMISDNYVNRNEKIILECHCEEVFSVSFGSFKDNGKRQCSKCSRANTEKSRRLTYDFVKDFIENLSDSGCVLISDAYTNNSTNLEIKCKCGNSFLAKFNHFKDRGKRQCNNCGRLIANKNISIGHEEFCVRLKNHFGDKYTVLGEFKGLKNNIELMCLKHNLTFTQKASSASKGSVGCIECQKELYTKSGYGRRKTHDEFIEKFYKVQSYDEYQLVSKYQGLKENVNVKHIPCDRVWNTSPSSLLAGGGCPHCSKKALKTTEAFSKQIYDLIGEEYELIGEYNGHKNKVQIKHTICDNEFSIAPGNFLSGQRCPQCNESRGEGLVRVCLESLDGIKFQPEMRFYYSENKRKHFRYDFLVNSKILIEFDGAFHFVARNHIGGQERLSKQIKRDILKNEYATANQYTLIRIPFWEKDNINIIVPELLNNIFNENKEKKSLYDKYIVTENWNHINYVLSSFEHLANYERKGFVNNLNLKENGLLV